jgi:hypothetical protein
LDNVGGDLPARGSARPKSTERRNANDYKLLETGGLDRQNAPEPREWTRLSCRRLAGFAQYGNY